MTALSIYLCWYQRKLSRKGNISQPLPSSASSSPSLLSSSKLQFAEIFLCSGASLVVQLGKESACNAGDPGSIPGSRRSPGEGIGYPFQYSWGFLGSSAGKESASNAGDPGSIPGSKISPGEGIGYPLQYSWAPLLAQMVKDLPAMRKTWV